jgi:hypothetical protein
MIFFDEPPNSLADAQWMMNILTNGVILILNSFCAQAAPNANSEMIARNDLRVGHMHQSSALILQPIGDQNRVKSGLGWV